MLKLKLGWETNYPAFFSYVMQFDNQRVVATLRTLSYYSLPLNIDLQMTDLILK